MIDATVQIEIYVILVHTNNVNGQWLYLPIAVLAHHWVPAH